MDPITSETRERLSALMEERAYDLGLSWRDVAARAKVSYETLRALRSGSGGITPLTARGVDRALEWEGGSVQRILAGGDPAPISSSPSGGEITEGLTEGQKATVRAFAEFLRQQREASGGEQKGA